LLKPLFGIIFLVLLVIIAGLFVYDFVFSTRAVTKRKLRQHQARLIRYVREGETVKVQGEVVADEELLTAPISGRPCVAWQVLVRCRDEGDSVKWAEVMNEEESVPFLLRDRTGQVLIQDPCPNLALDFDEKGSTGLLGELTPEVIALLARQGLAHTDGLGFHRATSWREGIIEPGERIAAMGLACRVQRDTQGGSIFALQSNGEQRVLLSDIENTMDG
jgi:hypothetical protein